LVSNNFKRIAILQSNYIPWKGYFDIINSVDEFILYDDMQYTRRDWRNRNKIITPNGLKWLSVPVEVKGRYFQKINETRISDPKWAKKHWATISQNYRNAPYFKDYKELFKNLYSNMDEIMLSQINYCFIKTINDILNITTTIRWSNEFDLIKGKTEKLVGICESVGATEYLSGPSAKGYLDESLFAEKSISVKCMDYTGYLEYPQQYDHHPCEHGVTVLDLLFNTGKNATKYMKSFY